MHPQQLITKWLARFADNTTGQINEGALREFVQDLAILAGTKNIEFIVGDPDSQEQEGETCIKLRTFSGGKIMGFRSYWDHSQNPVIEKLQFCLDTTAQAPEWQDVGAQNLDDLEVYFSEISGDPRLNVELDAEFLIIESYLNNLNEGKANKVDVQISEKDWGTVTTNAIATLNAAGYFRIHRVASQAGTNVAFNVSTISQMKLGETITLTIDSKNAGDTLTGLLVANGSFTGASINGATVNPVIEQRGKSFVGGYKNKIEITLYNNTSGANVIEVICTPAKEIDSYLTVPYSASIALNCRNLLELKRKLTLTGNSSLTLSNVADGMILVFSVTASGGDYTFTLPSAWQMLNKINRVITVKDATTVLVVITYTGTKYMAGLIN